MRWLVAVWRWFVGWLVWLFREPAPELPEVPREEPEVPPAPRYEVVHVTEDPDELLPGILYAVGENGQLWHVALACPCGCGAMIALNTLPDDSPRWTLREEPDGPTLKPSVWRTTGCRSHFVLRTGRVRWC